VNNLLTKLRRVAVPLAEFAEAKPLMGIKTGLNDAFLIDTGAKAALVAVDPKCAEIMRPYVRGQDITRWSPAWAGLWMICLKSSENHPWPWADSGDAAEQVFAQTFPSLHRHLCQFSEPLRKRQDQGRYWWELRSCAYWDAFLSPKIMYQDITWRSQFCLDDDGTMSNNTVYFLPNADAWTLAVLNSPIAWWFSWRTAVHGKDEALRYFTVFVEDFPIPTPNDQQRTAAENLTVELVAATKQLQGACRDVLDWLHVEHSIEKPSKKLQAPTEMDGDGFVAEVKKLRGKKNPLSAAALRSLRDEYVRTIGRRVVDAGAPAQRLGERSLRPDARRSEPALGHGPAPDAGSRSTRSGRPVALWPVSDRATGQDRRSPGSAGDLRSEQRRGRRPAPSAHCALWHGLPTVPPDRTAGLPDLAKE
jgi:hypothetical protein